MTKKIKMLAPGLRRDYRSKFLNENRMRPHPMDQFKVWFTDALRAHMQDMNAFVLATVDKKNHPDARVLLMKSFDRRGISFFTNYQSAKARQINANKHGAAVFYWSKLNRQIRLEGQIIKLSRAVSEQYFHSRPFLAQVAASVSDQSRTIANRSLLENRFAALAARTKLKTLPIPKNWGGYFLKIKRAEFWQGRENRLHDRVVYTQLPGNGWKRIRLQP